MRKSIVFSKLFLPSIRGQNFDEVAAQRIFSDEWKLRSKLGVVLSTLTSCIIKAV